MSIDADRYAFVIEEYRYAVASDTSWLTKYPASARSMEIRTSFDSTSELSAVVTELFGLVGAERRVFQIVLQGTDVLTLEDFDGYTPRVIFTSTRFAVSALDCTVTKLSVDENTGQTTLEILG